MNLAFFITKAPSLKNVLRLNRCVRLCSSTVEIKPEKIESNEIKPEAIEPDEMLMVNETTEHVYSEEELEALCNKSGLKARHFRKFHKQITPLSEDEKAAYSLLRLRRMYGQHGSSTGINVGLLWPSKEEMLLQRELEEVTYPDNFHRMIELAKQVEEKKQQKELERIKFLKNNVAKLAVWKKDLRKRISEERKLAVKARLRKKRLIEEVKAMFGYRIDPKDARFKEALQKKEKEEKKAEKAAKKLKKQQLLAEKLMKRNEQSQSANTKAEGSSDLQKDDAAPSAKAEGSTDLQKDDAAPSAKAEGSTDLQKDDAAPSVEAESNKNGRE